MLKGAVRKQQGWNLQPYNLAPESMGGAATSRCSSVEGTLPCGRGQNSWNLRTPESMVQHGDICTRNLALGGMKTKGAAKIRLIQMHICVLRP